MPYYLVALAGVFALAFATDQCAFCGCRTLCRPLTPRAHCTHVDMDKPVAHAESELSDDAEEKPRLVVLGTGERPACLLVNARARLFLTRV